MSSKSARRQQQRKLSRAEIKAYESRRAAERHRISVGGDNAGSGSGTADKHAPVASTSYSLTRNEEYAVIKADLIRLLVILAILLILLAAATVVLR